MSKPKTKVKAKPAKHAGGAPTKRTPEYRAKILQAIELGATYELAANYAGLSYQTFNEWVKADPEFSEAVKAAEGKATVGWLAKIEKAANNGNWQAAAWKLERRYPAQYGRTVVQNEVTGKDGGPILTVKLPEDWRQKDGD
jgi:transposase